jgi:hypothetical protein
MLHCTQGTTHPPTPAEPLAPAGHPHLHNRIIGKNGNTPAEAMPLRISRAVYGATLPHRESSAKTATPVLPLPSQGRGRGREVHPRQKRQCPPLASAKIAAETANPAPCSQLTHEQQKRQTTLTDREVAPPHPSLCALWFLPPCPLCPPWFLSCIPGKNGNTKPPPRVGEGAGGEVP